MPHPHIIYHHRGRIRAYANNGQVLFSGGGSPALDYLVKWINVTLIKNAEWIEKL
jgi:hypothetical protein